MSLTVGVDVGGTKIAAGLVDEKGRVLARERTESPATRPAEIVRTIAELVDKLSASGPVEAVGVSAAGFVDKARAMVVFAPNLAWRDEPLKQRLEEALGLPVVVENDANAAAWGEFTFGAGEDVEDLLMLTIGTGVGGGVVIDGDLLRGGFGMGAEVGHVRMVPGRHPVRVRQPRLPGVLRLGPRPGPGGARVGPARSPGRPAADRTRRGRRRRDHRADGDRGCAAG